MKFLYKWASRHRKIIYNKWICSGCPTKILPLWQANCYNELVRNVSKFIIHPIMNPCTGMSWVYKAPSKLITIPLVYGCTIQSIDHGTLWRPKNSHSSGNSWISHSIYVSLLESITIFPPNPFPISYYTPPRNHQKSWFSRSI